MLPNSWRQDPETLKMMQRRRKQLVAENAADRRKVVCPWRPGGKHIAQEPWQPFTPRDHRPPFRSASEGKSETHTGGEGTTTTKQKGEERGSGNGNQGAERRPHTAPTHRRKGFMDEISPRARRVLAAQSPGTSLHSAFSTYSTDPFPLEARHRPSIQSASARIEYSMHGFLPSHTEFGPRTSYQGTVQRAWAEIPSSPTLTKNPRVGCSKRPRSAAAGISRKLPNPPRRPATACGTRETAGRNGSNGAASERDDPEFNTSPSTNPREGHELDEPSLDLHVRSGPGVTVLWARLCAPSSDLIYKSSVWPKAPNASRPTRRRAEPPKKSVTTPVSTAGAPEAEKGNEQDSPPPVTESSSPADTGFVPGRTGDKAGAVTDGCPLEDLEDSLFASSSQRVNQRRRVFRSVSVSTSLKASGFMIGKSSMLFSSMQMLYPFVRRFSCGQNATAPFLSGFGIRALAFPFPHAYPSTYREAHPHIIGCFALFSLANGHRGYADRSRRERTWDPGSTFFAEGASKHHFSGPSSRNRRMKGGRGSGVHGAPSMGGATKRKHQRDRRRNSTDVHPVDMDWEKVT